MYLSFLCFINSHIEEHQYYDSLVKMIQAKVNSNSLTENGELCSYSVSCHFCFHLSKIRRFRDQLIERVQDLDLENFFENRISQYTSSEKPDPKSSFHIMVLFVRLQTGLSPEHPEFAASEQFLSAIKSLSREIKGAPQKSQSDMIIKALAGKFSYEDFITHVLDSKWIRHIRRSAPCMEKPPKWKIKNMFIHRRRKMTYNEMREELKSEDTLLTCVP